MIDIPTDSIRKSEVRVMMRLRAQYEIITGFKSSSASTAYNIVIGPSETLKPNTCVNTTKTVMLS